MDRIAFFKAINKLREGVTEGWMKVVQHEQLDNIIQLTEGGTIMSRDLTLQEDVARIIKRIKDAKENDALKAKANELIEKLKKEL